MTNIKLHLIVLCFCFAGSEIKAQESKRKQLDSLIIKKKIYHQRFSKKGYSIQLYNGYEGKALEIKQDCEQLFPDIKFKLKYDTPDWKVQTDPYITRLRADQILQIIQKEYPGARVF